MTTIRKDSYTFVPDYQVSRHWTEAQKRAHYDEQHHLFIVEALNTPYERVTEEMKNTWHSLGHRMASPSTGIGRSMQDDIKMYQAKYARKHEQSAWRENTKTFIKTLMRV